jgi:hypothetical protein
MPLPPSRSAYIPQATEPSEPEPDPEPKPKPKVETQTQTRTPTPTPTPTPQPQLNPNRPQPGHGFIRRHTSALPSKMRCARREPAAARRVRADLQGHVKAGHARAQLVQRARRARPRPAPRRVQLVLNPTTATRTCVWERGRSAYPSSCSTCALRLRTPSPSTLAPTLAL